MSDHFDLYCRTCHVKANVFHVNHGGAELQRVATDMAALAAMHDAWIKTSIDIRPAFSGEVALSEELLRFAAHHRDHDVAARSEYGGFVDRCSEWYRCAHCRHSMACQRAPKHDGAHGPADADPPPAG